MFATLGFAAALTLSPSAPPEAGALTLSSPRLTVGELGPVRTDNKLVPTDKYLPGDIFFMSFDIDGITVDAAGQVKYSMALEMLDPDGKAVLKEQPVEREEFLPLGGTKLPAREFIRIGLEQAAGTYTCKVTVVDKASKATQSLTQKFDVLKKDFGIIWVYTTGDAKGETPAPTLGVVGQSVFVHFAVVQFARDEKTKQPNMEVEMVVYDSDRKATLAKPTPLTIKEGVADGETGVPLRFPLPLNRAGDFLVQLRAKDLISKKDSVSYLPIRVVPAAAGK